MGAKRPLPLALAISAIGHIVFAFLFPASDVERRVARFDVELIAQEKPPAAEAVELSPAKREQPEPAPPIEAPPPTPTEVAQADALPDESEQAPAVLDLSRPADWDQIVNEIPMPSTQLAFNPALGEAVRQRNAERSRSVFVANRQAAIYGVADEDYARAGALGEELKMKGGCVTLREDKGVEEGQRWWASQCTESRQNPYTLPAVDYDALGRAIVD